MSNDEIFAAAYREHYWAVSRYVARRLQGRTGEVEEVVAEVFTVAWRRRGDLPEAPLPWLYGVARNCLANAVRGFGRRRRLVDRIGNDEAAHGRHIVASPDTEAPGAWVHEALDRLSPADREVLRLAAWEELGTEEIAVVLGCGSRAAAMRLHRARHRLRTEIDRLHRAARGPVPGNDPAPGTGPARSAAATDGPHPASQGPAPGTHPTPPPAGPVAPPTGGEAPRPGQPRGPHAGPPEDKAPPAPGPRPANPRPPGQEHRRPASPAGTAPLPSTPGARPRKDLRHA